MSINEKRISKLVPNETNAQDSIYQVDDIGGANETKLDERQNEKGLSFYEKEVDGCWAQLTTANKILFATTTTCCAFVLILVIYSIFIQG